MATSAAPPAAGGGGGGGVRGTSSVSSVGSVMVSWRLFRTASQVRHGVSCGRLRHGVVASLPHEITSAS